MNRFCRIGGCIRVPMGYSDVLYHQEATHGFNRGSEKVSPNPQAAHSQLGPMNKFMGCSLIISTDKAARNFNRW